MGMMAASNNHAPIERGLLEARITHARFSPKPYTLAHNLTYLHVPVDALPQLKRRFLARNGWGLFALNDRDYGNGGNDFGDWLRTAFTSVGATLPEGEITLVTLPRVLGFGFNPVSFWLCHNRSGALEAVLAEVNNTFGERHCYLCRKPDGSPISSDEEIVAEKVFHVSPFFPTDGEYRFRFIEKPDRVSIRIDLYREGARALTATIGGRLSTLTSRTLFKSFLRHPFPTLQVVLLIHYHAARLYMRGHKIFSKPTPPGPLVTSSFGGPATTITPEQT
ncbi:MAG TPA: DUF1365 domain-containing protein [Hyphomicrobium sp.]|nr:DUF1365 domain-containing protein [Hyphomicrobium sp.]